MNIAALAMVKDEADIIELFVRVNAEQVDHVYIVDNGSSDATPDILAALQREGLPLTVWRYATLDYQQDIITTAALRKIARRGRYDWIAPIDADEFIQPQGGRLADHLQQFDASTRRRGAAAARAFCALPWLTYVPLADDYEQQTQPLACGFAPRERELRQYYKVLVHGSIAERVSLAMGNHEVIGPDGKPLAMSLLPAAPGNAGVTLAHVPVRSPAQIMVKALVGSHKYSLKANRKTGEGYHWDQIAEQVRASGYRVDLASLRAIAMAYATQPGDPPQHRTLAQRAIGEPRHALRWPQLARIDLAARLDALARDLCMNLRDAWPQGLPTRQTQAAPAARPPAAVQPAVTPAPTAAPVTAPGVLS